MPSHDEISVFAKRLNEALDAAGVPPKGKGRQIILANMAGVSQKGARRWVEGEALPEAARLVLIAKVLEISIEWLMTGHGPMKVAAEPTQSVSTSIPVLPWEKATSFTRSGNIIETLNFTDSAVSSKTFAVRMKGSSMEPVFPEGTLLIIDPEKKATNRNYVLVLLDKENEPTFKQIFVDGDKKYLKSLSADFVHISPLLLKEQDKIIGTLVQARMDF